MALKLENLTIPIWIYDIDQYCIHWANPSALELWETESLEELRCLDFKVIMSGALQESLFEFQESFKQGYTLSHNWHFSPKGIEKHAFCQLSGYRLDDGRMAMLVEALPIDKLNYDMQSGLTVMLSDYSADGVFISGNPPFLQSMGRNNDALEDIVVDVSVLKILNRSLVQSGRFEDDVLMKGVRGDRWCHLIAVYVQAENKQQKILLHQYDIHQRKITEIALAREVLTDALTGLLNRRGLSQKLAEFEAESNGFLLYYIDLDGFKLINDSYGHGVGDQVLQAVAERLLTCLPKSSLVCRFGGDEFVAVVQLREVNNGSDFASALVASLSDVYNDSHLHAMTLSASVGVAQYPIDSSIIADVILYADAAMYQAKHLGKRRWIQYQEGMEQPIRRQSVIAQHLYDAERNGELSLNYQPVWDFSNDSSGRIVSFEALLRWYNPILGWVSPEELVKVAEEIGIIDAIECWVADRALSDLLVLREQVVATATMAVNVSAVHLLDPTFPQFLFQLLEEKRLLPEDLTVEFTESALVEDIDKENSAIHKFIEGGINISIDDFGTGYSSLAYLHQIPATTVKIDRSFVEQIEHNSKTVQHIASLIEAHEMCVLIEGVETEQQKQKLIEFGIYLHQGYLLGRPKPLSFYIESNQI
ncbi:MAG: diguanylate cyclase (GGDEF)-like protein [Candidatus Endobugula sp.]|jgi:diguanylate cyclase (GGDEF)-like protein